MVSNKIYKAPQIKLKRNKVSLGKSVQSGINPVTGEYLSSAERKELFKKRNISSSKVFGKGGAIVKVSSSSLLAPSTIDKKSLEERVSFLENQFTLLAKSLQKESELEKKLQREREKIELRESEKISRGKEESLLEKTTSIARQKLLAPVRKAETKIKDIFSKIFDFFTILLFGWLTNQGIGAIQAHIDGNKEKLDNIKNEVIKTLAVIGGAFLALNGGLGVALGLLKSLTGKLLRFTWNNTIGKLINSLREKLKNPRSPNNNRDKARSGGRNRGGGRSGGGGRSNASYSRYNESHARQLQGKANFGDKARLTFRNLTKGRSIKEILGSGFNKMKGVIKKSPGFAFGLLRNIVGRLPGPVGKALGGTFNFLGNLFNKGGKGLLKFVGPAAGRLLAVVKYFLAAKEVIERMSAGMTPAQAIIPILIKLGIMSAGTAIGASVGSVLPVAGTGLGFLAGTAAGGFIGDFVQNFIDDKWSPSWDKLPILKQLNGSLSDVSGAFSGSNPQTSETTPSSPIKPTSPVNNMPQVDSVDTQTPTLGPISDSSEPEIIYKRVSSGNNAQQMPLKSGAATDVPLISSSNPDNFHILFSLINYNVVA